MESKGKEENTGRERSVGRKWERKDNPWEDAVFNPIKVTSLKKIIGTKSFGFPFYDPGNSFCYAGDPKFDWIPLKVDSTYFVIIIKFSKCSKVEIIKRLNFVLFENLCSSNMLEVEKVVASIKSGVSTCKKLMTE